MKRYLWIDTSFLYALFVQADKNHKRSQALWSVFIEKQYLGITSNLVTTELGTLLAYHFGHTIALKHITMLYDSSLIQRVYADTETETASLQWWRKYRDKKYSVTDAISFEFMLRLGIKNCLSFDKDFEFSGFHCIKAAAEL